MLTVLRHGESRGYMAKKFVIELYCNSDAESIRNMITDVLHESLVKSVVAVGEEAVEHTLAPDNGQAAANNGQVALPVAGKA